MYILVAFAIGVLLRRIWPSRKNNTQSAAVEGSASKQPSDWLRRWWSTRNLEAHDKSTEEEYRHFLHLTLRHCTVGMTVRTEKSTQDFTARIFFPASIPDNRFQPILELIDEYNEASGNFPLELEKNHGTLWLNAFVDGATIIRSTDEERVMILHDLFNRIDMVFPEVMKVVYGFNMPALAVMKIAGMKQKQLN